MSTDRVKIFEEAIAQAFASCETRAIAIADIARVAEEVSAAVMSASNREVKVETSSLLDHPSNVDLCLLPNRDHDYGGRRELCKISLSSTGYPLAVHHFGDTQTSCPDVESFEHLLVRILRDPRTGLKVLALRRTQGGGSR